MLPKSGWDSGINSYSIQKKSNLVFARNAQVMAGLVKDDREKLLLDHFTKNEFW
jgi:hypothetical protein